MPARGRLACSGVLDELHIQGLGVIDDAVLPLGPGLTVVTGETGAGKTMVVTGLMLLFGGRAESTRVRSGSDQASVDGRLVNVPPAVAERVREAGGVLDDDDLVVRRVVSAAGRSRAYVGGASAPVAVLAELAEHLVAVHGQSDQLRLTRRAEQLDLLDRYAALDRSDYTAAYREWRDLAAALAERTSRAGELEREADLLRHGLSEIEAAAPEPGEDAALAELAARLTNADALRLAAQLAHAAVAGEDDADAVDVATLLGQARRALGQATGADAQLDKLASQLEDLLAATTDLGTELREYLDDLDADPQRLEDVQQRRHVLAGLIRKYGTGDGAGGLDAVLAWAAQASARLAEVDTSDEAIAELQRQTHQAAERAAEHAAALHTAREASAAQLSAAVTAELGGLALADAAVQVVVTTREPSGSHHALELDGTAVGAGPDGIDDVDILFQPHPRSAPLPIGRGASGGELSRVMLALEVCLAGTDPVPTMVFDEVDAGIGGRAAVEVGRRLARLARGHQVIVVTHLAQVAAYADRHIVVDKSSDGSDSVTSSDVRLVTDAERVGELARMLAGSDSATARGHAEELLAEAAKSRA
jgi:DNA repair protein RecN (Recombination protein N)